MVDSVSFQTVCNHIDNGFSILSESSRQFLKDLFVGAMQDAYRRGGMQAAEGIKTEVIVPIVNTNGTSRQDLLSQYQRALAALDAAIKAHAEATPHGRDYPVEGSYTLARSQHTTRAINLTRARGELDAIILKLVERI